MEGIIALMPLLDEDVRVWRPVEVFTMEQDLFRVTDEEPDAERWMFPPGSIVRCIRRAFQGDPTLKLAIVEIIEAQAPEGSSTAKPSDA